MSEWYKRLTKGYGKKLVSLHTWNIWIVLLLVITGLILLGGFWRGVLGEGRVWIKWGHIAIGIVSILPVFYYLLLAAKHWKQLKAKPWQRFNVLVVMGLLLGWFVSGVLLWQFKAVGPGVANIALFWHDLLTWVGLPYMIYHSVTRVKWLKEPSKRTIISDRSPSTIHPAGPRPLYTRRSFIRMLIGGMLAVTLGPSFLKWLGKVFSGPTGSAALEAIIERDANELIPSALPLPASSPPIGGGAEGTFRVYTVTKIPVFNNENWSFVIDGLVDRPIRWNWAEFVTLKRKVQVSDFHCVTGWSVYQNTWEGIPLKELLQLVGVKAAAKTVIFYSGDGEYADSLSLEQADMDDVMVAVLHDGKQIPSDLGGPARLIVPKMYAYKSVKWLNRIQLHDGEYTGYWELRGYSKDAWV